MIELNKLTSEQINDDSLRISDVNTVEVLNIINNEDQKIALLIKEEIPKIEIVVDEMTRRFKKGGRIIYVGAGSSGRVGLMDSVELNPTYGIENDRVFSLLAGGANALHEAVEGAEDSIELAIQDISALNVKEEDIIIGIAASGRTPYTLAVLDYASRRNALTVAITTNVGSEMSKVANLAIEVDVGAEVIQGSTRMKSGTAQKMIVNMISTAVMVKLGRVYKNQMVFVKASNFKLRVRARNILMQCTDLNEITAQTLLENSDFDVASAIVMHELNVSLERAQKLIKSNHGNIYAALNAQVIT